MTDPITIFRGTSGLNIVDPPTRIGQQENGFVDLQAAVNISIDQSGRPQTRRGVTQLQSGSFHSLFCDGGDCFVVKDNALYQVAADGSLSGAIRSGLSNNRMSYAQVGDRTYYSNGIDFGIIYQGKHVDWVEEDYIGPETHRHFSGPVSGNHIAEFFGRMLIAKDNVLWWSEPYNFGLYDMAGSFVQFYTKIIMFAPVDMGLFLSTEKNTYFLTGRDPKQWQVKKVAGYPAIEWTNIRVEAADIGAELSGQYVVWASCEGAILGMPDGNIVNLNKRKVIYPESARTGFGALVGTNYIHGMM